MCSYKRRGASRGTGHEPPPLPQSAGPCRRQLNIKHLALLLGAEGIPKIHGPAAPSGHHRVPRLAKMFKLSSSRSLTRHATCGRSSSLASSYKRSINRNHQLLTSRPFSMERQPRQHHAIPKQHTSPPAFGPTTSLLKISSWPGPAEPSSSMPSPS